MSVQSKSLSEITQQAITLLAKKIGIANTVRFLNQFSTGYGDYTQERETLFADLTIDKILSELKRRPGGRRGRGKLAAGRPRG